MAPKILSIEFISVGEAAKRLNCSKPTVLRAAKRIGVQKIIHGRYLLTPKEFHKIAAMPREIGNPNFRDPKKQSEMAKLRWARRRELLRKNKIST